MLVLILQTLIRPQGIIITLKPLLDRLRDIFECQFFDSILLLSFLLIVEKRVQPIRDLVGLAVEFA